MEKLIWYKLLLLFFYVNLKNDINIEYILNNISKKKIKKKKCKYLP